MRKIPVSFIAAFMAVNPSAAENPDDYTLAEKMAYLSDLGWFGNIEQATRRYEYLLPRFRDLCSDALTEAKAGDMLYASYLKVKEAGASGEENLLKYANNAYRVVTAVSRKYNLAGVSLRCADVFASYAHFRREGNSEEKSVVSASAGVNAIVSLAAKRTKSPKVPDRLTKSNIRSELEKRVAGPCFEDSAQKINVDVREFRRRMDEAGTFDVEGIAEIVLHNKKVQSAPAMRLLLYSKMLDACKNSLAPHLGDLKVSMEAR